MTRVPPFGMAPINEREDRDWETSEEYDERMKVHNFVKKNKGKWLTVKHNELFPIYADTRDNTVKKFMGSRGYTCKPGDKIKITSDPDPNPKDWGMTWAVYVEIGKFPGTKFEVHDVYEIINSTK